MMRHRSRTGREMAGRSESRAGFAMMTVLFVLLTLLVLTAPFLTTARNADRSSGQLADRAQVRVALDGAAKHARVNLAQSHPALDASPDWDTLEECDVTNRFAEDFIDANKPDGVMWDVDVRDVAGRIDLNSAGPHVLATMMDLGTRLSKPLEGEATEIDVRSGGAFEDEGFLWIEGEFVGYKAREKGQITSATRGLFTEKDEDDNWITDGPRPPSPHGVGAHVIDQRALAPVEWRIAVPDGKPRMLDTIEQLAEAELFALSGELGPEPLFQLGELGTVYGGVRSGKQWQRAARVTGPVEGGKTKNVSVDDPRWFGVGSTVMITDGQVTELRYVQVPPRGDRVILNRVLDYDYDAFRAEIRVLRKRPVNLNTASRVVLEALFTNLQLVGQNARISDIEARKLAKLTLASRPFEGLEDWMRRIVLPAAAIERLPDDAPLRPDELDQAEAGVIDPRDALALYINGLNANDARLAYSTMPFRFTSLDVYALELRASVNAASGVERAALVRDRVELVAPQTEMLYLWWRQSDFDEELRLGREAPWWATGPASTTRYDGNTVPPSRVWAHFGTQAGQPYVPGLSNEPAGGAEDSVPAEHVFAAREDEDAWLQLAPSRLIEIAPWSGRSMHFDHETRDLEGRYLPDETIQRTTADNLVAWSDPGEGGLMQSMSFSMWVKPQTAGDGVLLDVGGTSRETDRILLATQAEDLVLSVFDAGGDHRDSELVDVGEVRFAIAAGDGPGLPVGTWSHIEIDVTGNRPDQMHMRVNGLTHGVRRPGLTRLEASLSQGQSQILVESTDGFPARGVCRIGNELIEYVVSGEGLLDATHVEQGEYAGFGGRLARTQYTGEADTSLPGNIGLITTDHPAGATVTHYGYSSVLATNLTSGGAELPEELGLFRVARLMGVAPDSGPPDPIIVGFGYYGLGISGTNASDWLLALGDDPDNDADGTRVMDAFNETGGYAAIMQRRWNGSGGQDFLNVDNTPLGGIEIIRYSGYTGNVLHVVQRGVQPNELGRLGDIDDNAAGLLGGTTGRTFVFDWEQTTFGGELGQPLMELAPYVAPISIPAPGATDFNFLVSEDESQFAQITRTDSAELTEWVRYDEIQVTQGQLVRSDPDALRALWAACVVEGRVFDDPLGDEDPPGGGNVVPPDPPLGDGTGAGVPAHGLPLSLPTGAGSESSSATSSSAASSSGSVASARRAIGADWDPFLGEDELELYPLSRAASDAFQFRGVFGTECHIQPAGTQVLPVFQTPDRGVDGGRLGALDTVFVFGAEADHPGWPLTVKRAHIPAPNYEQHSWTQSDPDVRIAVDSGSVGELNHGGFDTGRVYVALTEPCPEIIAAGGVGGGVGTTVTDSRALARVSKFPSGERPRYPTGVGIGTGFDGGTDIGVPSMVIDEVVFGTPEFGRGMTASEPSSMTQGGQLVVAAAFSDAENEFTLDKYGVRVPQTIWSTSEEILGRLPEDAGLMRIGEEILCYDLRTPETGIVGIATEGRGLLGTEPQPHQTTEAVSFLEHIPVSVLAVDISAGDSILPLADLALFPPQGTVLIGDELIHYTRHRNGALEMPRASSQPGARDEEGDGIFRGRYGTAPSSHAAGTPVIYFHFRYWDRWADRAECPELSYFEFTFDQPSAWWNSVFWEWEPSASGAAVVGVLQRSDPSVAWDDEPDVAAGLNLMWQGFVDGKPIPIAAQSDRLEWRVFVRYDPGAFDLTTGASHAWKETPRFRQLGVSFFAPSKVLRSVER